MATFKEAFASARKAGKSEFTWRGKSYNTELKESVRPKERSPSEVRPKGRPGEMSPKSRPKEPTPKARPKPVKKTGATGAELKASNDAILAEQKKKRKKTFTDRVLVRGGSRL